MQTRVHTETEHGAPLWNAGPDSYSSGSAAALHCAATRLLEPALCGLERRSLAAMARIAKKRTRLGSPPLRGLTVANADEVAVRPGRRLIDATDAGRQAAA